MKILVLMTLLSVSFSALALENESGNTVNVSCPGNTVDGEGGEATVVEGGGVNTTAPANVQGQ